MEKILKIFKLSAVTLLIIFTGCSQTDDNLGDTVPLDSIKATVLKNISCQSGNGWVYEVELDENISISENLTLNRIGIVNLPEHLRSEGERILFDAKPSQIPDGLCVTLYSDGYFYEVIKVMAQTQ